MRLKRKAAARIAAVAAVLVVARGADLLLTWLLHPSLEGEANYFVRHLGMGWPALIIVNFIAVLVIAVISSYPFLRPTKTRCGYNASRFLRGGFKPNPAWALSRYLPFVIVAESLFACLVNILAIWRIPWGILFFNSNEIATMAVALLSVPVYLTYEYQHYKARCSGAKSGFVLMP